MSKALFEKWIKEVENAGLMQINTSDSIAINKLIWSESIHEIDGITFCLSKSLDVEYLVSIFDKGTENIFDGTELAGSSKIFRFSELDQKNIKKIRKLFPFTLPSTGGRLNETFGVGDRLGIASSGHLRVFKKYDVIPVLAQQSLRELDLTHRKYSNVIDAASWAVFRSGYHDDWIADGDHLKHAEDVKSALEQGCTMITADLSDHINYEFVDVKGEKLMNAYSRLDSEYRSGIEQRFSDKIEISDGFKLDFSKENLASVVLVYKNAIEHAVNLYKACKSVKKDFDFEVSIDETEAATTPEAHYFVAQELTGMGVNFTSIAPRFIGEFQKGIDYIGDLSNFENCFADHASIAGKLGYKLSVHSASDKFSAYPIIAENLHGAYHIKTSGTNWLCALKVIASLDPSFYRELHKYAYDVFTIAKSYYHVTPDLNLKCDMDSIEDDGLDVIFDNPNDRQVLHIAYGEILKVDTFKSSIYKVLNSNIEKYWDELESHIERHLKLLNI